MNKQIVNLVTIFTILFSANIASSYNKVSKTFAELYSRANILAETGDGAKYDRQLGEFFLANFTGVLDTCLKKHEKSGEAKFSAVFEIESNGKIKAFHLEKNTSFALCLKSSLVGVKGPIPPFDEYLNPFEWAGIDE